MSFTLADTAIYNDGLSLNTAKHNLNLYNSRVPDEGLYTKLNGSLDATDFRGYPYSYPQLSREHIWPRQMAGAYSAHSLTSADFFSDSGTVGGANDNEDWCPIPGASIRFYLPVSCSVALIDLTAYLSFWRPFYVNDRAGESPSGEGSFSAAAVKKLYKWTFKTRLALDGVSYLSSRFEVPISAQISPAETGIGEMVGDIRTHELGQGFCWSQHIQTSLTAGWHDAQLEYRMHACGSKVDAMMRRAAKELHTEDIRYYQRLYAGIRSARVLTLT